ncbi:heme peroxidase [Mycena galericulata]|nr:heme peroxidase [Mycena galericulata]
MFPLLILTFLTTATAYTWPSPQLDALEAARFNQVGFNAPGIVSFITPCDLFLFGSNNVTGRSDVSDWIRTAYHDMATHNATDGTGGLDASIRFTEEQARPENAGDGFDNSVFILFGFSNRYVSIADGLALGAILAIENCGGPEIAFRGGRADAAEPNAPGVPQPQQDLDSHIASFARQGFTQTEMIGLVACGHTFGGVQHMTFPDIVGELDDPNSTEDVAHFDTTFVTFDNDVAKEYISGTTKNPLVVGFNDTTNSDERIFGSDGNATMRSFANSAEVYTSTCANLFARMLDTVPRGVELTDVIAPLPVKPSNLQLILDGDMIQFSGQVRVRTIPSGPFVHDTRTVSLLWDDHTGRKKPQKTGPMTFLGVSTAVAGRYSAAWYGVNDTQGAGVLSLDAAAGITSMHFLVDGVLEDQGGSGFAVQDGFMFSNTSCVTSVNTTTGEAEAGRLDIAVRNGVHPTRVYLETVTRDSVDRPVVVETDIAPPTKPVALNSAYSLWAANMTSANASFLFTIGAEIDGVKYSTANIPLLLDFPLCAT